MSKEKHKPLIEPLPNPNDKLLNVAHPLPSDNHCWLLLGSPGDGKTSLYSSMLKNEYTKKFDMIFLFIPIHNSLPQKFIDRFDPRHIFHNMKILPKLLSRTDYLEGKRILFIFDDMQATLKEPTVRRAMSDLMANRRHIGSGASIWLNIQSLNSMAPEQRRLCSAISIFSTPLQNANVLEHVQDEFFNDLSRKEMKRLAKYIVDDSDKHNFLYANKQLTTKYYKKFDRVHPGNYKDDSD